MLWFFVYLFAGSVLSHHHHHGHHHHGHHFLDALSGVVSQISSHQESTTPRSTGPNGLTYGPSIVSLTKYNKDVHGPTIFHPDTGRLINLADYPNYSVVVPLAPGSPTTSSNQVFVSRRLSGPGEFVVVAPEGHGVMAVIQSLDLRTAPTGCNDFIQFGDVDSGVESGTTCGKVDGGDGSYSPSSLLGPRAFLSPSGSMKVLFYHGLIWGLVRDFNFDIFDPRRNPMLRVEIVFTAYKECDTQDLTNNHGYTYKRCTSAKVPGDKTCIPAQLFCDRATNCGFEDNFGSDEYITNCLPSLINLLLPQLNSPILPINPWNYSRPVSTSVSVSSTSAPTTSTTSLPPPTTEPLTTIVTTSTTTSPITTTTTSTTTTISTTTPPHLPVTPSQSSIELSTSTAKTAAPFRTQLHEHFFDLSPDSPEPQLHFTTTTTNQPSTNIPITASPTSSIISESSFNHAVQLPPEFGQTANFHFENLDTSQEHNLSSTSQIPQITINMTFTGSNNDLSVQEGEGQVEQLQSFADVNGGDVDTVPAPDKDQDQDASLLNSGEETSIILWIIFVFLVFLGVFCMLRMYCCRNRVVWIPNPKGFRARRKRRESSVYANANNFPEIHVSGAKPEKGRRRSGSGEKEMTPPPYDILFPKSSLHDADVLP